MLEDRRRPQDDAQRLAEWESWVPGAPDRLRSRLGVTLDGSPSSLVALWTSAMPRLRLGTPGDEPDEALPPWLRWPEVRPRSGQGPDGASLVVLTDVAAYYAGLLMTHVPAPGVRWAIVRAPEEESLVDEGQIVLAQPGVDEDGQLHGWMNPLADLVVLGTVQVKEPIVPAALVVGRNDPQRLLELFHMRLAAFS